jgi:hypothetical protein
MGENGVPGIFRGGGLATAGLKKLGEGMCALRSIRMLHVIRESIRYGGKEENSRR